MNEDAQLVAIGACAQLLVWLVGIGRFFLTLYAFSSTCFFSFPRKVEHIFKIYFVSFTSEKPWLNKRACCQDTNWTAFLSSGS